MTIKTKSEGKLLSLEVPLSSNKTAFERYMNVCFYHLVGR